MKTTIALLLSCASLLGADTGIQMVSTVRTNESGPISKREVYTRDGQTNLVRDIIVRDGAVRWVRQRVYYGGILALELCQMEDGLISSAKPVPGVIVGTLFTPEGRLDHVNLMTTNIWTLEHFTVTNGLLYPLSSALIGKHNTFFEDLRPLFSPAHVRNTSPEDFGREVEEFIKKHKGWFDVKTSSNEEE